MKRCAIGKMRGELRVWWIRNVPAEPQYWPAETVQDAVAKLLELEIADLADDEVQSNAGGLEVCEPVYLGENELEWVTWYGENGEDVDELVDDLRAGKEVK